MVASNRRGQPLSLILTVDDDAAVSRAVAHDLRRRYGQTHRILRAQSGEDALEALRDMKLRGGAGLEMNGAARTVSFARRRLGRRAHRHPGDRCV